MPEEKYAYNEYAELSPAACQKEQDRLQKKIRAGLSEYGRVAQSLRSAYDAREDARAEAKAAPENPKIQKKAERAEDACDAVTETFRAVSATLDDDLLALTKLYNSMMAQSSEPRAKTLSERKGTVVGNFEYKKAAIESDVSDIGGAVVKWKTDKTEETPVTEPTAETVPVVPAAAPAVPKDGKERRDSLYSEVNKAYTDAGELFRKYEATAEHLCVVAHAAAGARNLASEKPKKKKYLIQADTLEREQDTYTEDVLSQSVVLNKKILTVSRLYDHLISLGDDEGATGLLRDEKVRRLTALTRSKQRVDARLSSWISEDDLKPVYDWQYDTETMASEAEENKNESTEEAEAKTLPEETMENNDVKNEQAEVLKNLAALLSQMQEKKDPEIPAASEQPRPTLRIAPVTVDISKAVDKAVDAAFAKFRTAFERRVDDYTSRMMPMFAPSYDMSGVGQALEKMQASLDAKLAYMMKKIEAIGQNVPAIAAAPAEPVVVDVTATVEAAMAKVNAAVDEKLEAMAEKLAVAPAVVASKPIDTEAFDHAYQLSNKISDDEKFLIDKLTAMLESIKTLNDDMMNLTESYFQITEKQKEIVELQQQTNDLQRYTLREQEGVQVNQKVISTDQVNVIEAQTMIGEKQKAINEQQQSLIDSQKVMLVDQKGVIDVQAQLDEAMKTIVSDQQAMLAKHEDILKSNAQNIDIQNEIANIQNEVIAAQKEIAAAQKQIARDQKNVTERQKNNNEIGMEAVEDLKTVTKETRAMADAVAKLAKKTGKKTESKPVKEEVAEVVPVAETLASAVEEAPAAEVVEEAPATEDAPAATQE